MSLVCGLIVCEVVYAVSVCGICVCGVCMYTHIHSVIPHIPTSVLGLNSINAPGQQASTGKESVLGG